MIDLPEFQVDSVYGHQELTQRSRDGLEGRAERVRRKKQSWVHTKVWKSLQGLEVGWEEGHLQVGCCKVGGETGRQSSTQVSAWCGHLGDSGRGCF